MEVTVAVWVLVSVLVVLSDKVVVVKNVSVLLAGTSGTVKVLVTVLMRVVVTVWRVADVMDVGYTFVRRVSVLYLVVVHLASPSVTRAGSAFLPRPPIPRLAGDGTGSG